MPLAGPIGNSMGDPWAAVEDALSAYVRAATGFDMAHCYWVAPNVHRPSDGVPFATLEVIDRVPRGAVPGIQMNFDLSRSGQEFETQHQQILDCGFRVQIFAPPLRGSQPAVPRGAMNAATIAERVRLSAALQSVVDALRAVGVSIWDMGNVRYIPGLAGADFEGRAVLDLRFYWGDWVSDFTTYVETVGVTGTETDQGGNNETDNLTITSP